MNYADKVTDMDRILADALSQTVSDTIITPFDPSVLNLSDNTIISVPTVSDNMASVSGRLNLSAEKPSPADSGTESSKISPVTGEFIHFGKIDIEAIKRAIELLILVMKASNQSLINAATPEAYNKLVMNLDNMLYQQLLKWNKEFRNITDVYFLLQTLLAESGTGFIENQNRNFWKQIPYGISDMQHSGCGIFAAFNAIVNLTGEGSPEKLNELIEYFEQNGAALFGSVGTSPESILNYFNSTGDYSATMTNNVAGDLGDFESYDTLILLSCNEYGTVGDGMHYTCITVNDDGKYIVHNGGYVNKDPSDPDDEDKWKYVSIEFDTLEEAVNYNKNGSPICLIGIE
jgi:hypothetical protein